MTQTIRVSLPGYNALTDNNLDHFSLFADTDNVLIKRKTTRTYNVGYGGNPTIYTVNHGLGYVPFFMVYKDLNNNGYWSIVNNEYNQFEVPPMIASSDTSDLKVRNYYVSSVPIAYDIFYDNMSLSGNPTISESSVVFKVSRPNKSTSSTNPNDYIMHSDLNNLKILKQGKVTVTPTQDWGEIRVSHEFAGTTPYKFLYYVKCLDGKVILAGTAMQRSYNENYYFYDTYMNSQYISTTVRPITTDQYDVYYLIYGTGTSNMVDNTSPVLAVSREGYNVLTETNPDNFQFHSKYPTLKYYSEGTYTMTVSNTTVYPVYHGLGYVPVFIGFVNDIAGIFTSSYAIAPYYWGRSIIYQPNQDIGAFVYADANYLYLKAYYQPNAVGLQKTFTFYYKIFKNNLGF
jgi:hypothetical protein